jgi:hypothetical protein
VRDDLGHAERQQRAEPRCDGAVTAGHRSPLAPRQEDGGEKSGEEELRLQRGEPQRVLERVVVVGVAVEELVEMEVDLRTVGGLPERSLKEGRRGSVANRAA